MRAVRAHVFVWVYMCAFMYVSMLNFACCGAKLLTQIPPPNHFNQALNP